MGQPRAQHLAGKGLENCSHVGHGAQGDEVLLQDQGCCVVQAWLGPNHPIHSLGWATMNGHRQQQGKPTPNHKTAAQEPGVGDQPP